MKTQTTCEYTQGLSVCIVGLWKTGGKVEETGSQEQTSMFLLNGREGRRDQMAYFYFLCARYQHERHP